MEAVCDHAVILNEGKNMLEGSIDKLKELNALHEIEIKFKSKNELEIFAKTTSISKLNLSVNDDKIVISKEQSMDEIKKTILYELYNQDLGDVLPGLPQLHRHPNGDIGDHIDAAASRRSTALSQWEKLGGMDVHHRSGLLCGPGKNHFNDSRSRQHMTEIHTNSLDRKSVV